MDEARRRIREIEKIYDEGRFGNAAFWLSVISLFLDERQKALEWLERSYERRDVYLITINTRSDFDPLRDEPRFKAVVKKMGL